ncbi:MAG: LacI family DNA-binding transcriptional regulator [Kiritimatiellae bacterium]|nr:LacI family DNA-binding transcriptional regulator [Kiritimatiellia bacterium]
MPPTLEDVGRRCGVSRSTVSRVINNSPLVNTETKERVLKAVREMGYAPNLIARSLTTNRTETLAVTLPDITGGVFPEMLAGMDEVASRRGYHLLVVFLGGSRPPSGSVEDLVRNRRVDGVIAVATTVDDKDLEPLAGMDVTIVRAAQKSGIPSIPSVLFDDRGGARAATELLIKRGCRKLLHVSGPKDNYDACERSAGFREALKAAGIRFEAGNELRGNFLRESGHEAVTKALDKGRKFDGIFAGNDEMAIGAMEALGERGIAIPDEVALIGFDDIDVARFIGLSTVRVPVREMGRIAAQLALQSIDRKGPMESRVLQAELVERASTLRDGGVRPVTVLRASK